MGRLDAKAALVTAAAQGIGKASAIAMAREGTEVLATDTNMAALEGIPGISTMRLDVMDPDSIAEAQAALPAPSILFNCAGFVAHGTILDCDKDLWAFSIDLNMTAMYRMCRTFLAGMIEAGGRSIINMSSVASSVIAATNRFVYWGRPRPESSI